MNINLEDIDIDRLRKDLIEHFTASMFIVSPVALVDLSKVENASDEEVIQIAKDNNFNLKKYLK